MERGDGLVSSRQQGRIPKLPDSGIITVTQSSCWKRTDKQKPQKLRGKL